MRGGEGWEGNRIGLVCGTHEEDNGTGGGGASVTHFCFVARSTGVCHGCRLASPRLLSDSVEGPAAMRTGALGPLMRGVLFLIKDGQAIITIIIRNCNNGARLPLLWMGKSSVAVTLAVGG